MEPSDAQLIADVLVYDDPKAYTRLVERHQSPVRTLLRRLTHGDLALADDLAQETFVRAYQQLRRFRGDARFATWLYRIAYNIFLADTRCRHPEIPFEEELHGAMTAGCTFASDLRHDLEQAMNQLSVGERAVLTLCLGDGCTHEEAMTVLNLPLGTIKTHLLRGKDKLRNLLAEWQTP